MDAILIRWTRSAGILAAFTGLLSFAAILWYAPVEKVQGLIQKLMYVHVPAAIGCYVAFAATALTGLLFLLKGKRSWDRISVCSAEIGVLYCTVVLITGPIWGKPVWGTWWVWDARLTSTLILWLIYLAYFAVRRLAESDQGARFAAVLGILGVLDIPFINIAAEKFRTLHPPNVLKGGMTQEMGATLMLCTLAGVIYYVYLLCCRVHVEILADRALELRAEQGGF